MHMLILHGGKVLMPVGQEQGRHLLGHIAQTTLICTNLPFRRAQGEMRDALAAHDDLHTADGAHVHTRVAVASDHAVRRGRRYDTYATASGVGRAFRPLLHVIGPLWGPTSNYPLRG